MLKSSYAWHRNHQTRPAAACIAKAREDLANDKTRYSRSTGWGVNTSFAAYGESHMQWVENPTQAGLRFVGYVDEVNTSNYAFSGGINHKGWWTEDDGLNGETARGVVYQLPARNGRPQYLAGYEDPCNAGAVCLSLDIQEGEQLDNRSASYSQDARDVANLADGIAERMAEESRRYSEAWRAGREFEDLADEISADRKRILALLAERRQARSYAAKLYPETCAALRSIVSAALSTIRNARKQRAQLFADFGDVDGFVE